MPKREPGASRRLRWAGTLAAVLVLTTGTAAAQAYWQARSPLTAGTVASGSLDITTTWGTDWAAWKPLYPNRSSDSATLRVTETGSGTTLRWRISTTPSVSQTYAPFVTTQVFVGACGTGILIPSGGSYSPAGGYTAGQGVDLCLRVTLAANAPSGMQGQPLTPSLTVTANQIVS